MVQHAFFMAVTTGVRLLTGVVLFVLLARKWGPEDFGLFTYWISVTSIICLVVDYGFTPKVLREVGREPACVKELLGRVLAAKIGCSAIVVAICLLITCFSTIDLKEANLMWALQLAAIGFSFGDMVSAPLRVLGAYRKETVVVIVTSIVHFVSVSFFAYENYSLDFIALVFAISRFLYAFVSYSICIRIIGFPVWPENLLNSIWAELKSGIYYALDMGVSSIYQQLDTVLVNYYLGSYSVGIYQSGSKVLLGFYSIAQVANNIFVPKIAQEERLPEKLNVTLTAMSLLLFFVGLVGYLFLSMGGDFLQRNLFGDRYVGLREVFPLFGLLVLCRFYAAGFGIALTAMGFQRYRLFVTVAILISFVLLSIVFAPWLGLKGIIISLIFSTIISLVLYMAIMQRIKIWRNLYLWLMFVVCLISIFQIYYSFVFEI